MPFASFQQIRQELFQVGDATSTVVTGNGKRSASGMLSAAGTVVAVVEALNVLVQ